MEFGKVAERELDHIEFSLQPEPAWNKSILTGTKAEKPQVYLGCAKWGRKEWLGKIYPKGTKDTQFLDHYVHHYNSIELNATHYQIYGPDIIKRWADKAKGIHFKFCPKVPQVISHYSSFRNTEHMTNDFLAGISAFGNHLGPVFLQVSERYSPAQRDNLMAYLAALPKDIQFFLEVRHPQWFSDKAIIHDLLVFLKEQGIGWVITDAAGRRDCAHII